MLMVMHPLTQRFTCQHLADGNWTVFDQSLQVLASLGGMALERITENRARSGCDILNRIYANGLEARDDRGGQRRYHA